jgi:uncharacterized damage-inducible protein DinB
MSDVRRLSNFISRTVSGPMWHGAALSELLEGVSAQDAASHPIKTAHSIWEIVHHMTAWTEIAIARLSDKRTGDPPSDVDWPPVTDFSDGAWREAKNHLFTGYRNLAEAAATIDLPRLQKIIPGRDHSAQEMLHGLIEHGAYHGGQIALLKRAIEFEAATRETAEVREQDD